MGGCTCMWEREGKEEREREREWEGERDGGREGERDGGRKGGRESTKNNRLTVEWSRWENNYWWFEWNMDYKYHSMKIHTL